MTEEAFRLIALEAHIYGIQDIIFILLSVLLCLKLTLRLVNMFRVRNYGFYLGICLMHLIFTFLYYYITKYHIITHDSVMYFSMSLWPEEFVNRGAALQFGVGTKFISSIVNVLYTWFNIGYLAITFLFSAIGYSGLYLFVRMCYKSGATKGMKYFGVYFFPLILFFPNIHIWTVAIGKDSLIFFGIMLFTYSLTNIKRFIPLFMLGSFIIFMIRPHVFILLLISFLATLIFSGRVKLTYKLPILLLLSTVGYWLMYWFVINVFHLSFSFSSIFGYLENRQGFYFKTNYGGSIIDTSSYPFLLKLFSYVYRPLFERANLNYFLVSVDNVLSIFISLSLFSKKFVGWLKNAPFFVQFSFVYFLIGAGFFANIFSNFGLAVRQKTMFVYSLYIVIIAFSSWYRSPRRRILG